MKNKFFLTFSVIFPALFVAFNSAKNAYAADSTNIPLPARSPAPRGYVLAAGQIRVPWGNTTSWGLHMPTPNGAHCDSNTTPQAQVGIILGNAYDGSIHFIQVTSNNYFSPNFIPTTTSYGYYLYLSRVWVDSDNSGSNISFSWTLVCTPNGGVNTGYVTSWG